MTSAVLQWIAILTMVVDHVGLAFFPQLSFLRMIGRLSFPIFAFLLVEGFVHTSSRKKYALRLGIFALISEIPYELFFYGKLGGMFPMKNIFFSLLLGLAALYCAEKGRGWFAGVAALALAAELGAFSYGAYGILLVVCFYLCREKPWAVALSLFALTAAYCLYHQSLFQCWAVLAGIPLFFYSGQRGKRMPRYFFYIFYPAHLALIVGVRYAVRYAQGFFSSSF